MNNITGRDIALGNPSANMQELSIEILEFFHDIGFWTSRENTDGTYSMIKTKITDDQYDNALEILNALNDNGYTSDEQSARDNAAN